MAQLPLTKIRISSQKLDMELSYYCYTFRAISSLLIKRVNKTSQWTYENKTREEWKTCVLFAREMWSRGRKHGLGWRQTSDRIKIRQKWLNRSAIGDVWW